MIATAIRLAALVPLLAGAGGAAFGRPSSASPPGRPRPATCATSRACCSPPASRPGGARRTSRRAAASSGSCAGPSCWAGSRGWPAWRWMAPHPGRTTWHWSWNSGSCRCSGSRCAGAPLTPSRDHRCRNPTDARPNRAPRIRARDSRGRADLPGSPPPPRAPARNARRHRPPRHGCSPSHRPPVSAAGRSGPSISMPCEATSPKVSSAWMTPPSGDGTTIFSTKPKASVRKRIAALGSA